MMQLGSQMKETQSGIIDLAACRMPLPSEVDRPYDDLTRMTSPEIATL